MRPGKRLIWSLFKKAMPLFEDEKILTLLVARSPTDTDADLLGKLEFHAVHDNLTGSSPDTVEPSLSPGLLALWLTSLSGKKGCGKSGKESNIQLPFRQRTVLTKWKYA